MPILGKVRQRNEQRNSQSAFNLRGPAQLVIEKQFKEQGKAESAEQTQGDCGAHALHQGGRIAERRGRLLNPADVGYGSWLEFVSNLRLVQGYWSRSTGWFPPATSFVASR